MGDLRLIGAVNNNDYAAANALIKDGVDVNQQDDQGWTPLNFAAGKGNLEIAKLLIENGADMFKVGRDQRTPYMIALAAGRVSVVKYLKEAEANYAGEKPVRPERKYCKAYYLGDLRKFPGWKEDKINWKVKSDETQAEDPFTDEKVIFIHQDFTVTESMWEGENVIFNEVDSVWKAFCADTLKFKVPDDLDLIVANDDAS